MKYLIVIILIIILSSLVSALIHLFKGDRSGKMLKSLKWRIGLSILLILLLAVAASLGLITPHSPNL